MKKLILSSVTLIAMLFLFSSCAKEIKTAITDEQKAVIIDDVTQQHNNYKASVVQLNYDDVMKCYSQENFISSMSRIYGIQPTYSSMADSTKIGFITRERHKSELLDFRVTPLSPDMALSTEVGIWENWYKNGNYRKLKGLSTKLWKKELDGWKIIHNHESMQTLLEEKLVNPPQ